MNSKSDIGNGNTIAYSIAMDTVKDLGLLLVNVIAIAVIKGTSILIMVDLIITIAPDWINYLSGVFLYQWFTRKVKRHGYFDPNC